MGILQKLMARVFCSLLRSAESRHVISKLLQWRVNLVDPMQQAYRLQVDIPLWQVNTALTAMLRASQEMGGGLRLRHTLQIIRLNSRRQTDMPGNGLR